jgi:hypothetical protein
LREGHAPISRPGVHGWRVTSRVGTAVSSGRLAFRAAGLGRSRCLFLRSSARATGMMPVVYGTSLRGAARRRWRCRQLVSEDHQLRVAVEVGGGPFHPWSGECDSTGGRTRTWEGTCPTWTFITIGRTRLPHERHLVSVQPVHSSSGRLGRRTWPQSVFPQTDARDKGDADNPFGGDISGVDRTR